MTPAMPQNPIDPAATNSVSAAAFIAHWRGCQGFRVVHCAKFRHGFVRLAGRATTARHTFPTLRLQPRCAPR